MDVIHAVKALFAGYPHLIIGFNAFLPVGWSC
jgi:histone deacetylase complex regulatory component SIN3